jgi:hypothetical protein
MQSNGQRKLEQRTVRIPPHPLPRKEERRKRTFNATEEQEGWRTPDPSWLKMEAADDGEIIFMNLILAYEVESDEEEDDERQDKGQDKKGKEERNEEKKEEEEKEEEGKNKEEKVEEREGKGACPLLNLGHPPPSSSNSSTEISAWGRGLALC